MIYILITIIITAADQLIKYFVSDSMMVGQTAFSVLNVFDITYVQNRGAAFSMLSGKLSLLSVISIVFCIGVAVYWIRKKPKHPLVCTSLTMLFAGALGNGIDRIFRGFVVDYIHTLFIDFPVFNIADIGITIGAALLVIYVIWFDREDKNAENSAESK